MRRILIVAALLASAAASAQSDCKVLDTMTRYRSSTSGHTLIEYYELREVWVPGYFASRTVLVNVVYDNWGNAYPIWENQQVWVPGYLDRAWILVWTR